MSNDQRMQELLSKLSSLSMEGHIKDASPATFTELTPYLFDPEHHDAAQQLLTNTLSKKQSLLPAAASSILHHVKNLTPSDTFLISDSILKLIICQMNNPAVPVSVATQSGEALEILCTIRPPLIEKVLTMLQPIPTDSTIMVRYYTLITRIIPQFNAHAELMRPFMDEVKNDNDPLLQMSMLEILEGARDELILDWDDKSLDSILLSMVGAGQDARGCSSLHPFCAGAALRVLAKRNIPADAFVKVLMTFGRNMSGEVEKIGFIDGIATFCSQKSEHIDMLLKQDLSELLDEWLNLRLGQSKLKVVVMNSVAKVLNAPHDVASGSTSSHQLRLNLFKKIGEVNDVGGGSDSTEVIMGYVKSQVVELRLGAYGLLTAVARLEMGAHMLMRYGGFFEFLCNRNLEIVKEGKELKFDLVKAVAESDVKGLLADEIVKILQQVVNEGPYYVKSNSPYDVALE